MPTRTASRRRPQTPPELSSALEKLRDLANPEHVAFMARLGAPQVGCKDERLGVSITALRSLARTFGRNGEFAELLWSQPVVEAKQLSCLVEETGTLNHETVDRRAHDIQTWDLCDLFCQEVTRRTDHLPGLAFKWIDDSALMVRRAGWVSCAQMAIHRPEEWLEHLPAFLARLDTLKDEHADMIERKAMSWAIRATAKCLESARPIMISISKEWSRSDNAGLRRIGRSVLHELERKGLA